MLDLMQSSRELRQREIHLITTSYDSGLTNEAHDAQPLPAMCSLRVNKVRYDLCRYTRILALNIIAFLASNCRANDFTEWLATEENIAKQYMLQNVSPPGASLGAVAASPSRDHPNYFFHWVRDSAGVMKVVLNLYLASSNSDDKAHYATILQNFAMFSRTTQITPNRSGGVGEPKFYVDGRPFEGDWGRPQNDGPAARAIVMIEWAQALLDRGEQELVQRLLYDGAFPTKSLIKTDLEFIASHWQLPCFDLWEEVYGSHFYTKTLERRALYDGARLASRLQDPGAAIWYLNQAMKLTQELDAFWDGFRGIIIPTMGQNGGLTHKTSGLDSSVILGILVARSVDGVLGITDDRVLSTVSHLEASFYDAYPINHRADVGIAIGRYPEDRYDGYRTDGVGNPWVPTTAMFAQFYYRLARKFETDQVIVITPISRDFFGSMPCLSAEDSAAIPPIRSGQPCFTEMIQALRLKGDGYLKRIKLHSNPDGSLSEQINRHSGYMQGAPNLSISYALFLWATWERRNALNGGE